MPRMRPQRPTAVGCMRWLASRYRFCRRTRASSADMNSPSTTAPCFPSRVTTSSHRSPTRNSVRRGAPGVSVKRRSRVPSASMRPDARMMPQKLTAAGFMRVLGGDRRTPRFESQDLRAPAYGRTHSSDTNTLRATTSTTTYPTTPAQQASSGRACTLKRRATANTATVGAAKNPSQLATAAGKSISRFAHQRMKMRGATAKAEAVAQYCLLDEPAPRTADDATRIGMMSQRTTGSPSMLMESA